MVRHLRELLDHEVSRFLVMGTVNTGLTQLLYMAVLLIVPYEVAYTVSYLAGIPLAYWLNSRFVFRGEMTWRKFLQFPSVYVVQYLLGMALMYVVVEIVSVPEWIAPIPVLIATLPVTFLMTRFIIKD